MAEPREFVRRSVLLGAQLLRETAAGVRDAARELADPASARQRSHELELERARREGRWLSDAEREDLELAAQARDQRRRTLVVLLVISVLVPLLWPLLPLWLGLLLWPRTTRRLLWLALTALGLLLMALGVLVVWLLLR